MRYCTYVAVCAPASPNITDPLHKHVYEYSIADEATHLATAMLHVYIHVYCNEMWMC